MSNYSVHPIAFEITDDDTKDVAASVKVFDAHACEVEIKTPVDGHDWDRLSKAILDAISAANLVP